MKCPDCDTELHYTMRGEPRELTGHKRGGAVHSTDRCIDVLKAHRDRLRDALHWYAGYSSKGAITCGFRDDGGVRAREALRG